MKIIDAHCHPLCGKNGVEYARKYGIDATFKGCRKELDKNKISAAVSISWHFEGNTPIDYQQLMKMANADKRIFPVCAVNPTQATTAGFALLRKALQKGLVHGIKIYLGYLPLYATDKRYARFYKLAQEFDVPVVFHTGDTFGHEFHVKYAHPLQIDDVAVKFRKNTFVIAHMGNPWIRDTAEVVYKNPNVYTDLSALCIGSPGKHPISRIVINDIDYVFNYVGDPTKFLYGSDWPLVKMHEYIAIMKKAIPRKHHNAFFYKNAKKVFKLPV